MPQPDISSVIPEISGFDLSGLRDIRLPPEPPFWPPAVGWWYLAFILVLLGVGGALGYRHYIHSWRYQARRALKKNYARRGAEPLLFARDISHLLKRVVRVALPNEKVGRLSAEAWALFLKERVPDIFSPEEAKVIAFSTYMPHNRVIAVPSDRLYRQTRRWILKLKEEKPHAHYPRRNS